MARYSLLFLVCVLVITQPSWSQRYDSLLNALRTSKSDTSTIKLYHLLSVEVNLQNPELSIAYQDSALLIAKRINNPKFISITLTNIGAIYRNRSEYAKACSYYNEALKASPHFSPWLAETYVDAGIALLRMTELDSATKVFEEGLALVKEHPNMFAEASLYNGLGNVKREQNQYEQAIALYIQSLKIFEEQKDLKGQTQALANISNIHNLMGDTDKALEYGLLSLEIAKAAGVKSSIAYSYRLLGRIYRRQKKLDEALNAYEDAIQIYKGLQAKRDIGETEISIGNIYFDKANYSEAALHYKKSLAMAKSISDTMSMALSYINATFALLANEDYRNAKAHVDTAIVLAKKKNLANIRMDSYHLLSEIYGGIGDHKQSLESYKAFVNIRDSLSLEQNKLEAQEIEAKFQSEKKDDAIRLLNAENSLKANQQKYLVVILVLLLALAVILYSRYNVKQKANKKLKELDQIKTRFFTNISHEFRTPLSLILGPIEKKLSTANGDAQETESLKLMHRNARRLQTLINQLLDLSRIESGSIELHLEESDLAQTLRFIGSSFTSLAERKGIFYRQDLIESFVGCYDRDKLEKITNNLLSNAFKFTPEGGLSILKQPLKTDS